MKRLTLIFTFLFVFVEIGLADVREAAFILTQQFEFLERDRVSVVQPTEKMTMMIEQRPHGLPAMLVDNSERGQAYFFVIDHEPGAAFEHDLTYAWVDIDARNVEFVKANWPPALMPTPDARTPVVLDQFEVEGIEFTQLNTWEDHTEISEKPSGPLPKPKKKCEKFALVIDLGDKPGFYSLGKAFAYSADLMGKYLKKNGYQVVRRSQYPYNNHYGVSASGNGLAMNITDSLKKLAKQFDCNVSCCHNMFLYIAGHGAKAGGGAVGGDLTIYAVDGKSDDNLTLDDIAAAMATMPGCVRPTIFMDSCYSGEMINSAKAAKLCKKRMPPSRWKCGATVVTSTDHKSSAAFGTGPLAIDSGTEDFLESGVGDLDKDGTKGDFGDRFLHMVKQAKKTPVINRPKKWMCKKQKKMNDMD